MRPLVMCALLCLSCTPGAGETDDPTGEGVPRDTPEPANQCDEGATLFDPSRIHELQLELSDANWELVQQEADESLEYGGPDKTYVPAQLTIDGTTLSSDIAIRLKGHSSLLISAEQGRSFPFKIDFNRVDEDQDYDGLGKLNLHPNIDGITSVNEALSYGALAAHGLPSPRMGFARVTLNGQDLGLYSLVEHVKGKFVKCHFDEPYGDLYKPEEPIGNLHWRGDSIGDYQPLIQFKWPDESNTNHASLLNMIDVVNQQDVSRFDDVLNVDEVLRYFAANVALGNYDYQASFGHNYYLYESSPGRFTMTPWDMNFSQTFIDNPCGEGRNTEEFPISHTLLGEEETASRYFSMLRQFLQSDASIDALHTRLDGLMDIVGDDVSEDAVEELREVIEDRVNAQLEALDDGMTICAEWQ